MLPDIDSIALFVKAAEYGSLTRAAEACHMGLAGASRRIAMLEHRLKSSLLQRSPKGVELTPAGATLLIHARALLLQLNHLQADMDDHAAGQKGQLHVLGATSAMAQYLPEDLERYARDNPGVRVVVEERWSEHIISALLAGEADVGIVMDGLSMDGLTVLPYRTDRIAVVLPRGHGLAAFDEVDVDDVLDHELVALENGSSMMRLLKEQAVRAEKGLRLRVQVRGFEVVCRMVQAGLGIGVLPFQSAKELGIGLGLEARPIKGEWACRRMLACTKKDRHATIAVKRFLSMIAATPHDFARSQPVDVV